MEEEFPEGRTYPLNSKQLVFDQLQVLAKKLAVELPSGVSIEETRKLIEGRLLELEREPRNVQVVVGNNERIFLVGGEGVIVSTEHVSNKCTSHLHVRDIVEDHMDNNFNNNLILSQNVTGNEVSNEVESLRSALRESHLENEHLSQS